MGGLYEEFTGAAFMRGSTGVAFMRGSTGVAFMRGSTGVAFLRLGLGKGGPPPPPRSDLSFPPQEDPHKVLKLKRKN